MKNLKTKVAATTMLAALTLPCTVFAAAGPVNNNKLYFNGGQDSKVVYSEIYDALTEYRGTIDDAEYFNVIAYVKVGQDEHSSGWKQGYAYVKADRSFWHNETAYYDYQTRKEYTNWGGDIYP